MMEHHFGVVSFSGKQEIVIKEFDHSLDGDELFEEMDKLFNEYTEQVTLLKIESV